MHRSHQYRCDPDFIAKGFLFIFRYAEKSHFYHELSNLKVIIKTEAVSSYSEQFVAK